jgi:tRNA G18 (ribose-2'-O)-methylase SpoU
MRQLVVIAHNVRSCYNVGSLLRTAEGLGVAKVILSGYTPFPRLAQDPRLPHIADKATRQIHKTALGAEITLPWEHYGDASFALANLRASGFTLAALEQAPSALPLPSYQPPEKLALLVGREVEGVEPEILAKMDSILEIPMRGHKESFNVASAAAMALYHLAVS